MGVTLSNQDGVLTAALTGDIDHHTARELRLAIDEAIEVEVTHVPKYISRVFKLSGLEQLGVMEKKARPQKRNTEEEADNETR